MDSPRHRHLKLQIMATSAVVLVTFVIRVAFVCLNTYGLYFAIGEQLADGSSGCVDPCSPCHSTPYVINRFLFFFPELRAAVVLLSSPLTLLVACWGMTSPGNPTPALSLARPRLQSPLTAELSRMFAAAWDILKGSSAPQLHEPLLRDSAAAAAAPSSRGAA